MPRKPSQPSLSLADLATVIPGYFSRSAPPAAQSDGYLMPNLRNLEELGPCINAWPLDRGFAFVAVELDTDSPVILREDDILMAARTRRPALFRVESIPGKKRRGAGDEQGRHVRGVIAASNFHIIRPADPSSLAAAYPSLQRVTRRDLARWLYRVLGSQQVELLFFGPSETRTGMTTISVSSLEKLPLRLPVGGMADALSVLDLADKTAQRYLEVGRAVEALGDTRAGTALGDPAQPQASPAIRLNLSADSSQFEVESGLAARRQKWQLQLIDAFKPFTRMEPVWRVAPSLLTLVWWAEIVRHKQRAGLDGLLKSSRDGELDPLEVIDAELGTLAEKLSKGRICNAHSLGFHREKLGGGRLHFRLRTLLKILADWVEEQPGPSDHDFRPGDLFDLAVSSFDQLSTRAGSLCPTPPAAAWILCEMLEQGPAATHPIYDPVAHLGGALSMFGSRVQGEEPTGPFAALANLRIGLESDDTIPDAVAEISSGMLSGHPPDPHRRHGRIASDFIFATKRNLISPPEPEPGAGTDSPKNLRTPPGFWASIRWVTDSLREKGRAALLVPQSALGKGGREGRDRREFLSANESLQWVKAAILLPTLHTVSVMKPVLLVIERSSRRSGNVLMLDASTVTPTPGAAGKWGRWLGHDLSSIVERWLDGTEAEAAGVPENTPANAAIHGLVIDDKDLRENRFSLAFSRHLPAPESTPPSSPPPAGGRDMAPKDLLKQADLCRQDLVRLLEDLDRCDGTRS